MYPLVTLFSRYDVYVEVWHGLSCHYTFVYCDIKAFRTKAPLQREFDTLHKLPECVLFLVGELSQCCNTPRRTHERMARHDGCVRRKSPCELLTHNGARPYLR